MNEVNWYWPNATRAAVTLTYDDGNENNLDQAIPDLEARGLRGTFYLQTGRNDVRARAADWRRAFLHGHEIGNHTVRHPAQGKPYAPDYPAWLPPELRLEGFSPEDIAREVEEAADWLNDHIGPDPGRTFAYPCCATAIGDPPDEAPYDAAILRFHPAARIGSDACNDPRTVNLLRVTSYYCNGLTVEQLAGYCEEALRTGGWTVLMFHGIGGPSHTTDRPIHAGLLDYLVAHPAYWVAPLREVVTWIVRQRAM